MPWQMAAIDVPALIAYTLVVVWLAGRKRIARLSPTGPDQPAPVGGHPLPPATDPAAIAR
jgi:hypothetical protein